MSSFYGRPYRTSSPPIKDIEIMPKKTSKLVLVLIGALVFCCGGAAEMTRNNVSKPSAPQVCHDEIIQLETNGCEHHYKCPYPDQNLVGNGGFVFCRCQTKEAPKLNPQVGN